MKLYTMCILALAVGVWSGTSDASIPVMNCNGCTPQQEEASVITASGRGFIFVHNEKASRLRKLELWVDANGERGDLDVQRLGGADGVEVAAWSVTPDPKDKDRVNLGDRVGPGYKGWRRVIVEYPVDPAVKQIIDTQVAASRELRGLGKPGNTAGRVPVSMEALNLTAEKLPPLQFDLREIAWTGNDSGVTREFTSRLGRLLESHETADRLNPLLGDLFYNVWDAAKQVQIQAGTITETGLRLYEPEPAVPLMVCNKAGECLYATAEFDARPVKVTFEFATDRCDVTLPKGSAGFGMLWSTANGGEKCSVEYVDWLRKAKGFPVAVLERVNPFYLYDAYCDSTEGKPPLRNCRFQTP